MRDEIPVLERMRENLVTAIDRRREGTAGLPATRRRWAWAAAGGVAVAVTVAVVAVTTFGGSSPAPKAHGPLGKPEKTFGGAASCVETYSLANLRGRDFAFDGVIRSIDVPPDPETSDPTLVTFSVTRWYKGGSGSETQLRTYDRPGTITSVSIGQEDGPQLEVGARVLASGDEDFLWDCGFSMLYTPHNARLFEAAFEEG